MNYTKLSLTEKDFGKHVYVFPKLDSTNKHLMDNHNDYPNHSVIIAESQTHGRGRLGRKWIDSPGTTLSMSILLNPFPVHHIQTTPLVCGLCVRNALQKLTSGNIQLKWSNDVVVDNKKLCGILCESRIVKNSAFLVVGCGVNVAQTEDFFVNSDLEYGTSVKMMSGTEYNVMDVAKSILESFDEYFPLFLKCGFEYFHDEYNSYCVNIDKYVSVSTQLSCAEGKVIEVDSEGNLIVEQNGTVTKIGCGEASVRGMYGYC